MRIIKLDDIHKLHKTSRLKQAWFKMLCIGKNGAFLNGAFRKKSV